MADEGAAAHMFQLRIVGEFTSSSPFRDGGPYLARLILPAMLQAGGLILAIGSVAYFKL